MNVTWLSGGVPPGIKTHFKVLLHGSTFVGANAESVCRCCDSAMLRRGSAKNGPFSYQAGHRQEGQRTRNENHQADMQNICIGCQYIGGLNLEAARALFWETGSDWEMAMKTVGTTAGSPGTPEAMYDSDPLDCTLGFATRSRQKGKRPLPVGWLAQVFMQQAERDGTGHGTCDAVLPCVICSVAQLHWDGMMGNHCKNGWIAARKTTAPRKSLFIGDMLGACCRTCAGSRGTT